MELNVKERQTGKRAKARQARSIKEGRKRQKVPRKTLWHCSSLVFHIPVFGLVLGIGMYHLLGITLYERHKN